MLRVFVSSTFNDMHGERDCLEDIEQDLNTELQSFGERIEFVDLRWGICTEGLEDEEKDKAVLEGCFSAIDKADYFLIFLGDRYGTVKDYDEILRCLGKTKADVLFDKEKGGKSITELEITYARLIRGFNSKNVIVCIRNNDEEVETNAKLLIHKFTDDEEFREAIVEYAYEEREQFKKDLKRVILRSIKNDLATNNRFEQIRRELFNTARDAMLNSKLASYKIKKQVLIFSGDQGIGKTVAASELLRRNSDDNTVYYVSWEAGRENITYEQLLISISKAFAEWFKEDIPVGNVVQYIKDSIERLNQSGHKFVMFLDAENHISNINYNDILYMAGRNLLVISTNNHNKVLQAISSYTEYDLFESDSILFSKDEIREVIKKEFLEHGKEVREDTIDLLCGKKDIVKPLYLHFAIKRLLFLKKKDYEKCAPNESPELKVLSAIAEEMPEELNELLSYSINNIYSNIELKKEFLLSLELLSESHGDITYEALADYYIYNGVAEDFDSAKLYVDEMENRLRDFVEIDRKWIRRKYGASVYKVDSENWNINQFIDDKRKCYKDEYYIKENLYVKRMDTEKLCSFLSARCLWKEENENVRKLYRRLFWELVSDGSIKIKVIDEKIFGCLLRKYEIEDEVSDKWYLICERNPVFRLLTECLEEEVFNYEKGDGIEFLLRMVKEYLEELIRIYKSGILIFPSEIPMSALHVFGKIAYLYKMISKTLLNIEAVDKRLEHYYNRTADLTIRFLGLINILSGPGMPSYKKGEREELYCQYSASVLSSMSLFLNLNIFNAHFKANEFDLDKEITFNWNDNNERVFNTIKYYLLHLLTEWVKNFDSNGSQYAIDIVSIDYYINYKERIDLMGAYDNALMLSLILIYEIFKLGHFRKYNDQIELYWIKRFPETVLEKCKYYENRQGEDFEIRETVFNTFYALKEALVFAEKDGKVTLREKCILDIMKMTLLNIIINIDDEKSIEHTKEHIDSLKEYILRYEDIFYDWGRLINTIDNPDLRVNLPSQYMDAVILRGRIPELDLCKRIIRLAVKDLNFTCI